MKKILAIAILALCSLTIVFAKSYDITLSSPTKAGSLQLKPGTYRLKVEGTNAIFTDINSSKSFTTTVKVNTVEKKFDTTKVQSTRQGEEEVLQQIDLGGSTTSLGF